MTLQPAFSDNFSVIDSCLYYLFALYSKQQHTTLFLLVFLPALIYFLDHHLVPLAQKSYKLILYTIAKGGYCL